MVVLPNASAGNAIAQHESPATVAKTKAKYSYPWWASEDPAEVIWGQVNEAVQIVPMEKYIAASAKAMGREVFKSELSEPQALVAEFLERVSSATPQALIAKIMMRRDSEQLAKASGCNSTIANGFRKLKHLTLARVWKLRLVTCTDAEIAEVKSHLHLRHFKAAQIFREVGVSIA